MADQWGVAPPQPDGSWPPQPAPPYPGGPPQQYPPQPPTPPAPAAPYAADSYSGPYSGQYPGPYSAQHGGPYAPQPQPVPEVPQAPQYAPQHGQAPQPQPQPQQPQPPQPQPQSQSQPLPQYQHQNQQSASLYTSVPPPPSTLPPDEAYPQPASYPQPAAYAQPVPYPQAPGGPPVEASAGTSARPSNPFAVIGAVMSFVPVVGLVFSIIGLGKAKVIGGIGRGVATLGVALSLIFIPGWGVAGYVVYKAVDTTAADPACVAAEGDYLTYSRTLDADAADMAKTTYGTRQFTNSVKTYESDFQVLIGKLQADSDRAENADVHTAIVSLIADLQQLKAVMGDLASGDFSAAGRLGDVSTLNGKLFDAYEQTQNVCESHTGG